MKLNPETLSSHRFQDHPIPVFLCHFAFWFGLVFATPVFVATHNLGDLELPLSQIVLWTAIASLLLSGLSMMAGRASGPRLEGWICRVFLALALVLAIQGNIVNDLFYYGAFDGQSMEFRSYGWLFHLEWMFFILAIVVALRLFSRLKRLPALLPLLPIASFALLLFPVIFSGTAASQKRNMTVDPSVFAFSSQSNLIHLLPDGLQGDVVREVFEQNPQLAEKYSGFTLYNNHLGMYQGTAPSMITILTGEPFELVRGYDTGRAKGDIQAKSYQRALLDQGYQLDYVPVDDYICPDYASSCYPRPFSDLKSRGYYRHRGADVVYTIRLIADLSLFRLSPMFLKEKIHDEGHWFFADTMDGSSPWPDPVIREWVERITIVDDRPVYKWYHFIGTHIPPHWDRDCQYFRELPRERENFSAQAYCVLNSIASLLDRLREAGIYDQTAVLISSDHGHNVAPDDMTSLLYNGGLPRRLMGIARPTMLIKRKNVNAPLQINTAPTSLVDVAATALELVGIDSDKPSVMDLADIQKRERYFTPYKIAKLWSGEPVPFVRYRVEGPVSDGDQWILSDMTAFEDAPSQYEAVNFATAKEFLLGASLDRDQPDAESSWITGKQLSFLMHLPRSNRQQWLELVLGLPEWLPVQGLTIAVNGITDEAQYVLDRTGEDWQIVRIPLDQSALREGNNFFDLHFEHTRPPPDEDHWHTSGMVKSIRVIKSG